MKPNFLYLTSLLLAACNVDHGLGGFNPPKDAGSVDASVGGGLTQTSSTTQTGTSPQTSTQTGVQTVTTTIVTTVTTTATSTSTGTPIVDLLLPCGVPPSEKTGAHCVAAHSTVRVIVPGYTGPLYQLCTGPANPGPNSCQGQVKDIGSIDGFPDTNSHDAFCARETCTITTIYDQSGNQNHLEPAPKGTAKNTPDQPASASDLPVMLGGHSAYGVRIRPGSGYRTGCTECTLKQANGIPQRDEPQTVYMVTSQNDLVDGCCFDYGNAETTSMNDGNGAAEALNFGAGVVWGTGAGGKPGPWVMADLENGLYAGWENGQWGNISSNKPLKFDFVTAVLVGDTVDKNNGKGRFALLGADATGTNATFGKLTTMYDGIRPEKPGYAPMQKQGSIVLGIAGDNSNGGGGRFYEGAIIAGPPLSTAALEAIHNSIVNASYGTALAVSIGSAPL